MMKRIKHIKVVTFMFLLIFIVIKRSHRNIKIVKVDRFLPDMKHILIWTNVYGVSQEGQNEFIKNKCKFYNCYVTKNKTLFGDIRYFDVILFNLQDVSGGSAIPHVRNTFQKYVFFANNSADNYPVCDPVYDNFFNWTWTYRYDSTISYRFFTIFNALKEELGSHFSWYDRFNPVDEPFKSQFATKSKAAVVFLDECKSSSHRERIIENLHIALAKYNLSVDVFGKCGPKECKRKKMNPCFWRLKKTYYFYLAFEDSIAHDYVTDIVLYAYNNNAVPIVYGGARYNRYLPPNSYINARNITARELANTMYYTIQHKDIYFDYFRWKNHYSFSKTRLLNMCQLCKVLNNPARLVQKGTYYNFRTWWNPLYKKRCIHTKTLL